MRLIWLIFAASLASVSGASATCPTVFADCPPITAGTNGGAFAGALNLGGPLVNQSGVPFVPPAALPTNVGQTLTVIIDTTGLHTAWTNAGTGTVSSVGVTPANGFSGSVATGTTTPMITFSLNGVSGLLKGNGTAVSQAILGTDYLAPNSSGSALTGLTWPQIGSTPTNLSGYGITDGLKTTNNLSDVSSTSTARTNLGLGTIATQNSNAVAITGGSIVSTAVSATTLAAGSVPNAAGFRTLLNQDPFVSTLDTTLNGSQTVYGDLQDFTAVACYNGGNSGFCSAQAANVINFPSSGTASTTVTAPIGTQTLTLGSAPWCTQAMAGQPLYIAGVTAPGSLLVGCLSSTKIAISAPTLATATGATYSVQYGVNFQSTCPANSAAVGVTGCVGSTIITGAWAGAYASGAPVTITSVNSPTNITVSGNSSYIGANSTAVRFLVGHNDSAAVTASCQYAAANKMTLDVPVAHLVPALDRACYAVKLRGAGRLATAGDLLLSGATVFPEPAVVPWDAGAPTAPPKNVIARRDFLNTAAAGIAPTFAMVGDSLDSPQPNDLNDMATYPGLFMSEFLRQNPGIRPTETLCGVGGAQTSNLDGNPNALAPPCITSTSTAFLGQVNTNVAPNMVEIGMGNNDGTGLSPSNLADIYQKLTLPSASGGSFTKPVDVVFTTHHPYSRINGNGGGVTPIEYGMDYAAGYYSSFADVVGRPLFDGAAEGEKHLWGYDPRTLKFERAYNMPYGGNSLALPASYENGIPGFAATFTKSGVAGATFWSSFTGNSGVTDARGPYVAFQVGYDQGQQNRVWFFELSGVTIGMQCDPSNLLPGYGCVNPATGKPPVVPSLMGTITVSGANPGVVTTSTGFGWPCTVGMTVAVPQAGATDSPSGYSSYVEPWITTITACTSNTSITGTGAAPTPGTYTNSFVMSGNPIISTGVVDVGDGSGNEKFHVEIKGDDLYAWWNTAQTPIYVGKVMRPRTPFQWRMWSGGNRPTLNIAVDDVTSEMTTWQVAKMVPNLTDFVDTDVNGPAANSTPNNAGYIGPSGGDGNNHNTSLFGERVLRPMYQAADFVMPPLGVIAVTTATYTVPGCNVGRVPVNRAGVVTVTLAPNCPANTQVVVQDVGGNAGGSTITVAGSAGYTLSGTATITSAYGLRTITYTGVAAAISN